MDNPCIEIRCLQIRIAIIFNLLIKLPLTYELFINEIGIYETQHFYID
jgi:hypothetical protein